MPRLSVLHARPLAATALAAALASALAPAAAQPQPGPWHAVVSRQVHLRAGPGPDYPILAVLIPGTAVEVRGCLPSYAWCDVEADARRGWVHGSTLEAWAGDDHTRLPDVGALLGIAIIGFAWSEYWHDHYRGRPFYGQRDRWAPPPAKPRPPAPTLPHPPAPRAGPPAKPPEKAPEKAPPGFPPGPHQGPPAGSKPAPPAPARPDAREPGTEPRPDNRPDTRPDTRPGSPPRPPDKP